MNQGLIPDSGHAAMCKSVLQTEMFLAWGGLSAKLSRPTGLSTNVSTASGALPAGTYYYAIAALNPGIGETQVNTEASAVLTGTGNVTLNFSSIVGYPTVIYRGTVSGTLKYVATVDSGVNTYNDTGAIADLTHSPAGVNESGFDLWTTTPDAPSAKHTRLSNEVGRRKVLIKKYVKPDENGVYETVNGKWSESLTPTKYMYAQCAFSKDDASSSTIYQFGAFIGTVAQPGHELSNYLLPNQVLDPGTLLAIDHVSPIIRSPANKVIQEVVFTF